jgi:hypothetical protein
MTHVRFAAILATGFLLSTIPAVHAGQDTAAPARVTLTPEQMETFLLKGNIVRTRAASSGVTDSIRATLDDGRIVHDAHIQVIDDARAMFQAGNATEVDFKDSYRYNIAGYRIARMLGVNVPMSVERTYKGKPAAVTWWVDDVVMDEGARLKDKKTAPDQERFRNQIQTLRIFDELIQNKDRNQGNLLWTSDWDMWMIDHTRAFRLSTQLLKPVELRRCERSLYEKLQGLTRETVTAAVGQSLTAREVTALLARRDAIIKVLNQRIADTSERAVLYVDATRK